MSKKEKIVKTGTLTIRMAEQDIARLKRACFRDEIKPASFAHDVVLKHLELLILKQQKHGYKCESID